MSVTFVTAFHPVRSDIGPYLEKFDLIASTGVPILLFLDTEVSFPRAYPNVKILPATLDTSWVPDNVSLPAVRSLEKDTVRYLALMLKKLKYMTEALDHCGTPYLSWIDFGISHVIRYPGTTFQKLCALESFSKPDLNTILIAGCWGPNPSHDIWNSVYWRFCGGFFLGPRDVFPRAYARQTELVQQNLPKLTWEVNYWTLMEEFFTFYPADHNDSMIMSMPYSRRIQRITNDSYYLGGTRKVAVGGPIEQYVYSHCGSRLFPVFPKTDMLVEHGEFVRMRSTMEWQDPAIHDMDAIKSQIQPIPGLSPVVCVDTAKCVVDSGVLLLPTDDTTFSKGLVFPYELPPWDSRKNCLVWRGASSGCEYPSLRLETVRTLRSNPHADVCFTRGGWPQNDAKIPDAYFGSSLSIEDQLAYKYILSIDGNGAASNIEWILASGAVPDVDKNPGLPFWFKDQLTDGVNCVLVENPEMLPVRLAELQANDVRTREIACNAIELSKSIFRPEFQKAYIDNQLTRIMNSICDISWKEYFGRPGTEHYTLLESFSKSFENRVLIDIGTHTGASALALSKGTTNRVYSFDIAHSHPLLTLPNVTYHLDNLMTPEGREKWKDELLGSALIFLDIDPHEGTQEFEFYEWLRDNEYKGFVVADDIWYFKGMRDNFWFKIPSEHKIDVTDRGHMSGTGIIRFQPSEMWPARTIPSNWTVVTAYFDLTKMPDASPQINSRPSTHYLSHANATMSLDQNLVVYCEPDTVDLLRSLRPAHLLAKTQFVPMSFEDFRLTKYRDRILENRKVNPDPDGRNTASYYLLCMSRYAMLKKTIAENPFGSTHFAWLNVCIERMGYKNLIQLDSVFLENRDKFSTCHIDYQPRTDIERSVRNGSCSMCSGFFTGNAQYMKMFCDRIEEKFLYYLDRGIGHADEQLFNAVFYDDRSIFDTYLGDYTEMVTNYVHVRDHPSKPLDLVIRHSFDAGDYEVCLDSCKKLWRSFKKGYAELPEQDVAKLIRMYRVSLGKLNLGTELE